MHSCKSHNVLLAVVVIISVAVAVAVAIAVATASRLIDEEGVLSMCSILISD